MEANGKIHTKAQVLEDLPGRVGELVGNGAAKFGGKYLVRGGQTQAVEGEPPRGRIVVIEFDSLAAARSFEDSPDYQAITPLRHKAASSRVFLAEGPNT